MLRTLWPLLLTACLVRDDLYLEARERLNDEPHVWADCDGDGWGDPAYVAHLPEVEPACEGTWVDNRLDCDDDNPSTSFRSGALCADEVAETWALYELEERELLLITDGSYTLQQAENRCGPIGWGGELARLTASDLEKGLALPAGFGGWVGASLYGDWEWSDGSAIDLPFCSDAPDAEGLVVIAELGVPTCLGGPDDIGVTDRLEAPGFLCQRPL